MSNQTTETPNNKHTMKTTTRCEKVKNTANIAQSLLPALVSRYKNTDESLYAYATEIVNDAFTIALAFDEIAADFQVDPLSVIEGIASANTDQKIPYFVNTNLYVKEV